MRMVYPGDVRRRPASARWMRRSAPNPYTVRSSSRHVPHPAFLRVCIVESGTARVVYSAPFVTCTAGPNVTLVVLRAPAAAWHKPTIRAAP